MADIRAALAPSRSGFTPGRIGVMRALNRHVERELNPSRNDPHWGKRKLKHDE
jgi:hypothetical protein